MNDKITDTKKTPHRLGKFRIAFYIGSVIIIVFFAAVLGIGLLLRTSRFQNIVKVSLQKSVSSSLNGDISWKSLKLSAVSSVDVLGLELATNKGDPVISIDRAHGRIALLPLLQRRVVLSTVSLHHSTVSYNTRIHPNFVDVFTIKPQAVSAHPPPMWTFAIRRFFIDSLNALYIDSAGRFTNLACAKISGRLAADSDFTLKTNAFSLRLIIPEHSLSIDTLYFSMRSGAQGFACDSISIKSTHMAAHGAFAIPLSKFGPLQGDLVMHADNFFFKEINAQAWGLEHCDIPTGSVRLRGCIPHPSLTVVARINNTVFRNFALGGAAVDLKCDSAGTASGRVSLNDQALSGALDFSIRAHDLFSKPNFKDYHIRGDILMRNIHDLNHVIAKITPRDLIRKGAMRLSLSASGSSFKQPPSAARCMVDLTDITLQNGKTLPEASIKAEINSDTFSLKGAWPEVFSINASGSMKQNQESGSGNFEISNLSPLALLLFNQDVLGAIKGDFTINKFLSAPIARMRLRATGISWKELSANDLFADFSYSGKTGPFINKASVNLKGPIENALKSLGKPGIRGFAIASINAQGPLSYPNATAAVSMDTLFSNIRAADLIKGTITLHDSLVTFKDLKITKGPIGISGSGSFDRSRKNITADLSISGVSGYAPGALSIKGTLADISEGMCTATDLPTDVLHTWFPLLSIPSSKLSMQTSFFGRFSNPSIITNFRLSDIAFVKTDMKPQLRGRAELSDHKAIALCTLSVGDTCAALTMLMKAALLPAFGLDTLSPLPLEIKLSGSNVCLGPLVRAFSDKMALSGTLSAEASATLHKGIWTPEGSVNLALDAFSYPALNLRMENVFLIMKPPTRTLSSGIDISLQTGKVRYCGVAFPKISMQAALSNGALIIDTANIFFEKGRLSIAGNVPLVPIRQLSTHRDIHLDLTADSIGAINCNPFISGGRFTAGTLNGHILVAPGPSKIKPEGKLSADGIVFAVDELSPPIGPVQFTVNISGDSMNINGKGLWGKGTIYETGFAAISNNSLGPMHATLIGKNLVINYLDDTHVRIDSLNASLSNPLGKWGLDGYALLGESNAAYNVPFNQPIAIRRKTPDKNSLALSIGLKIPNCLTMDIKVGSILSGSASEVKTSIGGTLQVRGTIDNPRYAGQVQIDSGSATYLSRGFSIKQGYARLTGAGDVNPFIDILATTNVSQVQTTYGTDSITITLHISGNLKKPVIVLTSNKGFSQLEIISLLTFGSTTFSTAGGAAVNPASLISSSLSGVVSKQAQKTLGLEQVQFQGNLFATGSTQANASVSVSKKISPNVTVSYSRGIADTISQQGVISWKLKPFLFLEFESNDRGNAGIDLKYRIKK